MSVNDLNNIQWAEVLVAIGRIEEGMKGLRETVDRLERKGDARDVEIRQMQLEIQELKTQRSTVKENIAVVVAVLAVLISGGNALLRFFGI